MRMPANFHLLRHTPALSAGLLAVLVLLAFLVGLPGRVEAPGWMQEEAQAGLHELHPADAMEDDLPARGTHKPASKPCKRINQLAKSLLAKPAMPPVSLLAFFNPPAEPLAEVWIALPELPLDSSLVRRSGITRAPPVLA